MIISSTDDAVAHFEQLSPVKPFDIVGLWKGNSLASGHPLDGVLEKLGWFGKRFRQDLRADPLLFTMGERRLAAVDPGKIPIRLAVRFSRFGHKRYVQNLSSYLLPRLRAKGPIATLRTMTLGTTASAAMVYDEQPIIDHFRWAGTELLRGMMTMDGMEKPYFFELRRVKD